MAIRKTPRQKLETELRSAVTLRDKYQAKVDDVTARIAVIDASTTTAQPAVPAPVTPEPVPQVLHPLHEPPTAPREVFLPWQLACGWDQLPGEVREAAGAGISIGQSEVRREGGAWSPTESAVPLLVYDAGEYSAHANEVIRNLLSCAPKAAAIHAYNTRDAGFRYNDYSQWQLESAPKIPVALPPYRVLNCSWSGGGEAPSFAVGFARMIDAMFREHGIPTIASVDNGSMPIQPLFGASKTAILVASAEDSGAARRGIGTWFEIYRKIWPDLEARVSTSLVVPHTAWNSFAAPCVASMIACLLSFFGTRRSGSEISTAIVATSHPETLVPNLPMAYSLIR